MWLRCFYASQGAIQVTPLWLPLGSECVVTPAVDDEKEEEEDQAEDQEEEEKGMEVAIAETTSKATAGTAVDATIQTEKTDNTTTKSSPSSSSSAARTHQRGFFAQLFGPAWMKSAEDFGACYKQSQRWQWGAIDVGFILVHNAITPNGSPPRPTLKAATTASAANSPASAATITRNSAGNAAPVVADASRRFAYEKGRVLFTAYEHHLLANVMW